MTALNANPYNTNELVRVANLTKTYPDMESGFFTAVNDVSFCVPAGEVFALLGPNGAGKTTVLRILSTILQPTTGTVTINGAEVSRSPDLVRRSIGFVSSNTALYDRMSASELVDYFGRIHGLSREQLSDRKQKLFEQLMMTHFGDTPCGKMSTGMKQKVSIARALIHDPPVLIFDEASIGLDVLVARSLLDTIASLRDEGKCIIFSTHIMREVERLCKRVAIMHRGRILDVGTLAELSDRHGHDDFEDLFIALLHAEEIRNGLVHA